MLIVNVNGCVAAGGVPVAVMVIGNTPAVDGVPASTPAGVNVIPAGNAVDVNVGEFVAVMV